MSSKRKYDSTRRSAQAADTRERIAASARRLFVENGFAGTTIEAIAAGAKVAAPTVYAAFGSKRAILIALLDDMEVAADRRALERDLAAAGDPASQMRAMVGFTIRLFAQSADVIHAVRTAGASDPAFDELRVEGEARRRRTHAPFVRAWSRAGALRKGLSEAEAADVLWAMCNDGLFRAFVVDLTWPVDRYLAWLCDTLEMRLFRVPAPTRPPSRRR